MSPGSPEPRSAVRRRGLGRVLVVDDELRLREGLAGVLRRQYVVETAGSAEDALSQLRSGARFDVILSDVMMPGVTGVDLYELIAREFPSSASCVVFMTGALLRPFQGRLSSLRNVCLDKPLDLRRLRDVIDGCVAAHGVAMGR